MKRIDSLDGLRGLAAIAVVLYHYTFEYDKSFSDSFYFPEWLAYFKYGVELFFVISGYVIFMSLSRVGSPFDFLIGRFSRLYPVYWISVMFTFVMILIFELPGREVSLGAFLLNFLMFHEYLRVPSVDGVYWTLNVELTFYFWCFLCISLLARKYIFWFLFASVLLSFVLPLQSECILIKAISKILFLEYSYLFLAGICIYKHVNEGALRWLILYFFLAFYPLLKYGTEPFLINVLILFTFYFAVFGRLPFLRWKVMVWLGTISYPLYLVHQNFGYILIREFSPIIGRELSLVAALSLSMIISYLFVLVIERPASNLIKRAYSDSKLKLFMHNNFIAR